jgi:hypothetical protein
MAAPAGAIVRSAFCLFEENNALLLIEIGASDNRFRHCRRRIVGLMRDAGRNIDEIACSDPVAMLETRAMSEPGCPFEHVDCRLMRLVKMRPGLGAWRHFQKCMQIAFVPADAADTPVK